MFAVIHYRAVRFAALKGKPLDSSTPLTLFASLRMTR